MDAFQDFVRHDNVSIHQDIAHYLREKIESGILQSGTRIPSLRSMAKLWHTNLFSIKLATDELVGMGLLNKQQGRGIFVALRSEEIIRIGLYTSQGLGNPTDMMFSSVLRDVLCHRLQERGIEYLIWSDWRPESEHTGPPATMQQAILTNSVQAVIGIVVRNYDNNWFSRLPVRKTAMMYDPMLDFNVIAEKLKKSGCRRIAAIVSSATTNPLSNFLIVGLKETGIKIMLRNIRLICDMEITPHNSRAEMGYRAAMDLLTSTPRPDALIVYPDNAVMGTIQAILELGIKVPEELFVLFHRNVELDYFCSFDADYIDTEITKVADMLIENIIMPKRQE